MFNRHIYQKLQHQLLQKQLQSKKQLLSQQKRKKKSQNEIINYKSKVRNFLVELASNPIQIGQYQPPFINIIRTVQEKERLGAPQMFINGYKTNKQRLQKSYQDNKIIDYSPTKTSPSNYKFRQRIFQKQIQPQMRFTQTKSKQLLKSRHNSLNPIRYKQLKTQQNQLAYGLQHNYSLKSSLSTLLQSTNSFNNNKNLNKINNNIYFNNSTNLHQSNSTKLILPSIKLQQKQQNNPQNNQIHTKSSSILRSKSKTYFKAIQQIGNSLKMMEQTKNDKLNLKNRLMNVNDGKQVIVENMAMDLLKMCKLAKRKKGQIVN